LGPSQRKLGKARNRALAEKRRADAEEPGEEELAALLNALDEANAAALRILASMDRSHELLQGSIRELRMARNSLTGGLAAQEKEAA